MARGERLALMDVVENTRDFAGKENFQVAKQLWETLYMMGANISSILSVCASISQMPRFLSSPQKPGAVSTIMEDDSEGQREPEM